MLQQQLFTFHQFADRAKMSVWISSRLRSALFTCLLYAVCTELANCQSSKNLYFSFTTAHSTGYSALGAVPAIDLALQRINDEPSILPGYNLSYAMNVGNSLVSFASLTLTLLALHTLAHHCIFLFLHSLIICFVYTKGLALLCTQSAAMYICTRVCTGSP